MKGSDGFEQKEPKFDVDGNILENGTGTRVGMKKVEKMKSSLNLKLHMSCATGYYFTFQMKRSQCCLASCQAEEEGGGDVKLDKKVLAAATE